MTVLPGFVATRTTEDLDLPKKLTAEPSEVGDAIVHAGNERRALPMCARYGE